MKNRKNIMLSLLLLSSSALVSAAPLTGQVHLSGRIVEPSCHTAISSPEGQITCWQNGKAVRSALVHHQEDRASASLPHISSIKSVPVSDNARIMVFNYN